MNGARSLDASAGPIIEPLEARLLLDGTTAQQAIELFHTTPAVFIENQGQWADASVRFVHRGQGANIAHTDSGPVFELFREVPAPEDHTESQEKVPDTFSDEPAELERLRFSATFDGANAVMPVGLAEAETRFNFLLGDPSGWRENVPSYEVVAYEGLYNGIDLHTWGRRDHLKYEFHVAPGADFSQISISYSGIEALRIDEAGALHVRLPGDWGEVVDDAPYIYQVVGGEQVEVAGAYRLVDGDTYAFDITGAYDPARPLVIDPDLDWSSYLGGSDSDVGFGIAADAAGNALVTGETASAGWVSGGWDTSFNGGSGYSDAFVVKLSPSGGHLWSTYLGGSSYDYGCGIAADEGGNVLVTGSTGSSGWVSGGWDTSFGGGRDGFVVKLSASGGHLWSSYLGENGYDYGYGIAADAAGNAVVTGHTNSYSWISGGWNTSFGGGWDGFVVKLSATGGRLWSTYLGGSGYDDGYGIAADAAGNVLVTGTTNSAGWVSGGWDTSLDDSDGFVVKLSASGGHVWSSYLGGGSSDHGYGIAVDAAGNALVTGRTESSGWVSGGWDTSYGGEHEPDAFVVKLSAIGEHLWSTYLGGSGYDCGCGIATDVGGSALVTGRTQSSGWVGGGWDTSHGGSLDAFVVKLSASGGHLWSSYLGGNEYDWGRSIAADTAGNALVTGETRTSGWVSGGWDTSYGGGYFDGFVVKISVDTTAPTADAWYSVAVHGRGVGELALEIADDGMFSEPRTGGGAKLVVEFSEPIDPATFGPGSVRVAGNDANGQAVDLSDIAVSTSTAEGDTVGVIEFAPRLPDVVRYLVRIEGVTDVAGNPLAGDSDRVFTALIGDAENELRTKVIDLSYIWANRVFMIDGVTEAQTRSDINCDRRVNAIDLSAAWAHRGSNMQDVPDPVLSEAEASSPDERGDGEAEAFLAFLLAGSVDDQRDAALEMGAAAVLPGARPAAGLPVASAAWVGDAADVAAVPIDWAALEADAGKTGTGSRFVFETVPVPAFPELLDVLSLAKLAVLGA